MEAWIKLPKNQKQAIITNVANRKGFNEQVVEKTFGLHLHWRLYSVFRISAAAWYSRAAHL